MTKNQTIVMWAGLIILLVYLFTDRNFKGAVFGASGHSATGTQLDVSMTNGKAASNPWAYPGAPSSTTKPPAKKTTLA